MAELVGGALLSSFLSVLFQRLATRQVVDFVRGHKTTNGLLRKLKLKLLSVKLVVDDAEEKQIRRPEVREWLDELKDTLYDARDLLDEINTEAQRRELEGDEKKLESDVFDKGLETKMVDVLERLEVIVNEKDALGLKEGVQDRLHVRTRETTSLVDDSGVYGRDHDKETIIKLLFSADTTSEKISVIPIVGMGGIGKTTLAQLVYNDVRVKQHFDLQAWVCVSDEFDVLRITQTIYESITAQTCGITKLDLLQNKLKEKLMMKKFLVVLDDVWNENYMQWDTLRKPFGSGAIRSKIIVTARNQGVASVMCTLPSHHLMQISEENCWLLFAKHAFGNADLLDSRHRDLASIGKQIAEKCKGLPLAVKSLGGLLRSEVNKEKWVKILKSDIWKLSEKECPILPALLLSYHYLPSHLKHCFAYCAIFPKDYPFTKSELVLLWMAEDLLQLEKKKMIEEVGDDYFNDLISRSFFQSSLTSEPDPIGESLFTMHDLLNDLAKYVSGEFCFRLEDDDSSKIVSKTRHFSYMKKNDGTDGCPNFEALHKAKSLHTFLSFQVHAYNDRYEMPKVLSELWPALKCLRLLNLSQYDVRELPSSIGNLKHLRHLDLSDSSIKNLPDTLCSLYNLQTLLLCGCRSLVELPTNLGRLIKLRHLDISSTKIDKMPQDLGKLKDLHFLSDFVLDKDTGHSIAELREFQHLHKRLCISGLDNIVCQGDALKANIISGKKCLKGLVLKWGGDTEDSEEDRQVLELLQPHANLKELRIESYGGTRFPNWVGDHSCTNLVSVALVDCKFCSLLPPLGHLPSLVKLDIGGFSGVVSVGLEFCGNNTSGIKPFRSLKELTFVDMLEWEEWCYDVGGKEEEEGGIFPNLHELVLERCPKLIKMLPFDKFSELEWLELWSLNSFTGASLLQESKFLSLSWLRINECPKFECFPDGGIEAPNLKVMHIESCEKFLSLPEQMHTLFPSLEFLHIDSCPELESFPQGDFSHP